MDLSEDDGFIDVVFDKQGGSVRIDVYRAYDDIAEYHNANKSKPNDEYHAGLIELMGRMGVPVGSARLAQRFCAGVMARVEELKKNLELTPASPASTATIPPG